MVENSSAPRHAECASEWRERRAPRRSCRRATRALGPAEREKRATARGPATNGQQHPSPRVGPTLRRTRPGDVVHDEETPWVTPSSTTRATSTSGVVRPRGGRCAPVFRPRVPAAPRIFSSSGPRASPGTGRPFKQSHPAPHSAPLCPRPRVPSSSRTNPTTRRSPSHRTVTRPWTAPAAGPRRRPAPPARAIRAVNARPFRRISHPIIPPRETRLSRPDLRPRETRPSAPIPDPAHRPHPRHSQNSLSQTRRGGDGSGRRRWRRRRAASAAARRRRRRSRSGAGTLRVDRAEPPRAHEGTPARAYDPSTYAHLDVSGDIRELFQYIFDNPPPSDAPTSETV